MTAVYFELEAKAAIVPTGNTAERVATENRVGETVRQVGGVDVSIDVAGIGYLNIGHPGRIGTSRDFLDEANRAQGVWITTRRSIAEYIAGQVPAAA